MTIGGRELRALRHSVAGSPAGPWEDYGAGRRAKAARSLHAHPV
jgi:hypothetical protein